MMDLHSDSVRTIQTTTSNKASPVFLDANQRLYSVNVFPSVLCACLFYWLKILSDSTGCIGFLCTFVELMCILPFHSCNILKCVKKNTSRYIIDTKQAGTDTDHSQEWASFTNLMCHAYIALEKSYNQNRFLAKIPFKLYF